ncbi:MAG: PAS domain S-box protein [Deltaproteobacteria bacterium]|nr:PAS domain S-box protein [Deltaproteobacteria bacterium]
MPTQFPLHSVLKTRLKWLMAFRVALVIIFLGTSLWFQFRQTSPFQSSLYPIYAIIIITCLLTILYGILFRWVKDAGLFAYIQIFGDILLVTATVYTTGGLESLLSFLYFLSIISASILLNRKGGFYAASASSIAYGFLVNLDFYRALPAKYKVILAGGIGYERGDILATVALNIIGFFTVAFLTGYLAERTVKIERELEEKKIDFKKLEAMNNYIIENINSGILTIDANARITSFNKAAEKITGYTLGEMYNKTIDTIFHDLLETGNYSIPPDEGDSSYFRIDTPFKTKDGRELFLGLAVSPMKDGGYIAIFQDLTRLKNMEEQLRRVDRLHALGELAASLSHEVRNPLASISGSVQVLKHSLQLNNDNQRLMDIVIREADRLNALVADFLLFAKPAVKMTKVNLNDIVSETVDMFKNSHESKNIDIQAELEDSLFIEGDSRQLKQVLWNLFLNAGHAMPDGGRLEVRGQGPGSGEQKFVEITVSDTGTGIPLDIIEKIFDPFFTTRDSGTGLGLAVVHRIIEGHKGTIEVKSKKGEGTSFKITLPVFEPVKN